MWMETGTATQGLEHCQDARHVRSYQGVGIPANEQREEAAHDGTSGHLVRPARQLPGPGPGPGPGPTRHVYILYRRGQTSGQCNNGR